jgi:hypothetical protein
LMWSRCRWRWCVFAVRGCFPDGRQRRGPKNTRVLKSIIHLLFNKSVDSVGWFLLLIG